MTEVYLLKVTEPDLEEYNKVLSVVSENRVSKIKSLRQREKQLQALFGELLLRAVLCTEFGFKNNEITIKTDGTGKPYLVGNKIFFNISHTDGLVAVAVSDSEVGIDCEYVKEVNLKLIKRYFSIFEQEYVNQNESGKISRFFEIWTKKEAFLKRDGVGIRKNLSEVETIGRTDIETFDFDGYIVSLCGDVVSCKTVFSEISSNILRKFLESLNICL